MQPDPDDPARIGIHRFQLPARWMMHALPDGRDVAGFLFDRATPAKTAG